MRARLFGTAAVLLVASMRLAAQGAPRPVLVELFTSEGCSSCPPADALLRQLDGKTLETGQLVIGLSEHVTYWNRLGWTDPFSADIYTARQEAYRSRFGLDSAYTPQVVVNGEHEVLGSDRGALLRAAREAGRAESATVHIDAAKVDGEVVRIRYTATGAGARGTQLFAVVADDVAMSQVRRGENSGHTLTHVSVARSLTEIGGWKEGSGVAELRFGGLPRASGGRHVVLFAQKAGQGPIAAVDIAPI